MRFVEAGKPWLEGRGVEAAPCGGWLAIAIAFAATVCFALAPPASAAVAPTVLDPVAPGVPAHSRAWELITPGEVSPIHIGLGIHDATSVSGQRFVFTSNSSLDEAVHGSVVGFNLAVRGSGGWSITPLAWPLREEVFSYYNPREGPIYDPELMASIWVNNVSGNTYVGEAEGGVFVSKADSPYTQIANLGRQFNPPPGWASAEDGTPPARLLATSDDLGRVLFKSERHQVPGDATRLDDFGVTSLYEITGAGIQLVDVNDGGTLISNCGSQPGAVRDDARQVFFTANPACGPYARAYLRAGGQTTEISASQCTASCGPEDNVLFLGATASGSEAFIATAERLTDEDANSDQDIYRYDVGSGELTLLYERPPASTVTDVAFQLRASDDGSRVYFAAAGQLLPGQGSESELNLYLADAGGLHFVAPVLNEDLGVVPFAPLNPSLANIDISAEGRYALFPTRAPLADDDTDERKDLYRYDAVTGVATEVSAGVEGLGNGDFNVLALTKYMLDDTGHQISTLTGDGAFDISERALFITAEQLLPQDHNDRDDLYEWTPAGLGLISGGVPGLGAQYAGVTPDGGTVFLRTAATLLPRDRDGGEFDLYAARVGGGFPETDAAAGCEEACEATAKDGAKPARPTIAGARIELAKIGPAARRQLASRGWTTLLAEVPVAGKLSARGQARIGSRQRTAAMGGVEAREPGPVRLRLRLTEAAKSALVRKGHLRVHLVLSLAGQRAARSTFALEGVSR